MARWRAAGLSVTCRTATPEFGFSATAESAVNGPTRNPWNPQRVAGGSSGGSAALVAAGALPWAHANDAGGSIRIPAALCGVVGLKPTRGLVHPARIRMNRSSASRLSSRSPGQFATPPR